MSGYRSILIIATLAISLADCRKSDYLVDETETIRDLGGGTGTVTWTSDRSYVLEGFVYVNDGQTLTIEPGTLIRAKTGQGTAASALIVTRGGRIIAEGTASDPIIFTCEGDDLSGSVPVKARGLWGGLIMLGNARLNSEYNENSIEGIPISEPRGIYGGNNDDDDSGILRYISIRHGGTNIGEGNEINGLTLGGVGRGTTIDHIEVIANADDGFEFFGGTVNGKYLVSAFCADDAFDYDEGYHGNGQFWMAMQDNSEGNHLVEANGGIHPENGKPYSIPQLYNLTLVGTGGQNGNAVLSLTRNAGGIFANSIFMNQSNGILIEYKEGLDDSYRQFEQGNIRILSNLFYDVSGNDTSGLINIITDDLVDVAPMNDILSDYLFSAGNRIRNTGITYTGDEYELVPLNVEFDHLAEYPDNWFDEADFKGAFGSYNWASGWTLLSLSGYLKD